MSERRSGRSRKQVDYSKFAADNDDDFADPTPPPPKKKRMSEKTEGRRDKDKPSVSSKVAPSDKPAGRKGRLPREEKLYERDLQAALDMSLQSSQSQEDQSSPKLVSSQAVLHSTPMEGSHHALPKTEMPAESQCIMPSAIPRGVAPDNDIEFLGTVTDSDAESPPSKRRAATKKKKTYIVDDDESTDDEDFSDGGSEGDTDSELSDADSDFDDGKGKSKKKVKGQATPAKSKPTAATRKNNSAAKCDNKASTGPNSATPETTPAAAKATPTPAKATPTPAAAKATRTPAKATPTPAKATPAAAVSAGQGKACGGVKSVSNAVRATPPPPSVTSTPASSRVTGAPHKPPVWTPPGGRNGSDSSSSGASLKSPSSGLRLGLSRHARIKPLHPSLQVS